MRGLFRLETGLALASIGLHGMFIAYLLSFYHALSRPIDGPNIVLHPTELLMVAIFIFALPGFGLACITYFISKRDAPRMASMILIAHGILMPLGMFYASTLTNNINEEYRSFEILTIPIIFLVPGFIPIGFGVHIAKLKPVKRRYT
ncbi:MAG: hypothetical protein EX285_02330 [Thaumarchaeota archaeon]|nr:hypothetical protein [Nitrososphaerota archaeon]